MILPVTDGATVGRPGFGRNIRTLVQGTLSEIDLLNTKWRYQAWFWSSQENFSGDIICWLSGNQCYYANALYHYETKCK